MNHLLSATTIAPYGQNRQKDLCFRWWRQGQRSLKKAGTEMHPIAGPHCLCRRFVAGIGTPRRHNV